MTIIWKFVTLSPKARISFEGLLLISASYRTGYFIIRIVYEYSIICTPMLFERCMFTLVSINLIETMIRYIGRLRYRLIYIR